MCYSGLVLSCLIFENWLFIITDIPHHELWWIKYTMLICEPTAALLPVFSVCYLGMFITALHNILHIGQYYNTVYSIESLIPDLFILYFSLI